MTSNFNTVLIIGGTSGIGEAFARRFHSLGKKVIVTGRRLDRLDTLAKELKGIETYQVRTVASETDLLNSPFPMCTVTGCRSLANLAAIIVGYRQPGLIARPRHLDTKEIS